MFLAIDSQGRRVSPSPGLLGCTCPACGSPVTPRCARNVTWYFAHDQHRDCDDWSELASSWQAGWLALVPPDRREVPMGRHRADLVTVSRRVVDLQQGFISSDELVAREAFYGPSLIWMIDARRDYREGCLELQRQRNRDDPSYRTVRWSRARKCLCQARGLVILDLGDTLFRLATLDPGPAPNGGFGFLRHRVPFSRILNGALYDLAIGERVWHPQFGSGTVNAVFPLPPAKPTSADIWFGAHGNHQISLQHTILARL